MHMLRNSQPHLARNVALVVRGTGRSEEGTARVTLREHPALPTLYPIQCGVNRFTHWAHRVEMVAVRVGPQEFQIKTHCRRALLVPMYFGRTSQQMLWSLTSSVRFLLPSTAAPS